MGNAQCGQMFTVLLDLALVGATLLLLLPFAWSSPGECSNPALVALAIAMPSLAAAASLFVCCVAVLMPADENNDMPGGGTRSNSDHMFGAFFVAFLACVVEVVLAIATISLAAPPDHGCSDRARAFAMSVSLIVLIPVGVLMLFPVVYIFFVACCEALTHHH